MRCFSWRVVPSPANGRASTQLFRSGARSCSAHRRVGHGSGGELMRGLLMACAVALALMAVVPASSNAAVSNDGGTLAPSAVYALQQPSAPVPKVDINVTHSGGGRWDANPVGIAIGAVGVV